LSLPLPKTLRIEIPPPGAPERSAKIYKTRTLALTANDTHSSIPKIHLKKRTSAIAFLERDEQSDETKTYRTYSYFPDNKHRNNEIGG
jgi:hypothetical protein